MDEKKIRIARWGAAIVLFLACVLSVFVLVGNRFGLPEFGGASDAEEPSAAAQTEEMSVGEGKWYCLDNGKDPGNGNVWTTDRYDAQGWTSVTLPFSAAVSDGEDTRFFRQTFQLESRDLVHAITGNIRYSDAVVVYLNGEVIFAGNVPAGGYASSLETGCADEPAKVQEEQFQVTDLSALQTGENVLAVELHQSGTGACDAYFDLPYINLIGEEVRETTPQLQRLFLELGADEKQIYANFVTKKAASMEVGYLTESELAKYGKETEDWDPFAWGASYVLAGRTYDKARGGYAYRAPLSLLRENERYGYRIRCVGGKMQTEMHSFDFSADLAYRFAVCRSGVTGASAKAYLDAAVKAAGKGGLQFYAAERDFAESGAEQAAEIPVCLLHETGNRSFTYHDVLFLVPDPDETDAAAREAFIRAERKRVPRRWTVVLLDEAKKNVGQDLYADLGVDLTINAASQDLLLVQVTEDALRAETVEP